MALLSVSSAALIASSSASLYLPSYLPLHLCLLCPLVGLFICLLISPFVSQSVGLVSHLVVHQPPCQPICQLLHWPCQPSRCSSTCSPLLLAAAFQYICPASSSCHPTIGLVSLPVSPFINTSFGYDMCLTIFSGDPWLQHMFMMLIGRYRVLYHYVYLYRASRLSSNVFVINCLIVC